MCAFLVALQLVQADDFVKQLTAKDLAVERMKLVRAVTLGARSALVCSIPLNEVSAGKGKHLDPISKLAGPKKIDEGIKHPVPIPACAER